MHSGGPWKYYERLSSSENHKGWIVRSPDSPIAEVYPLGSDPRPEAEANARLIAAAPEMLDALKLIKSMFEDGRIVRNIKNDGEPGWMLKMLHFVRELQTICLAIDKADGPKEAEHANG